ncbi:uncharacterized protein VICG_00599 [Vittaforma corneae ATCC 50505]|uniref:Sm domain-containing protein n=1 Tax=Vittaforma corneae (strain ATCC 50505) TaxID=993615 RepID=L2GPR6_VITCO|nr:uncharacterized protein VICG_00599 [Vittaforma corneae ATCC 50505]ELA42500.1 hypothetical protein VICG_00599 [Vittaforma corneae ATCC 50505]
MDKPSSKESNTINTEENIGINDREFVEYLEKNVVVLLKDDIYLYGVFKSYDQYNSITLNYVLERIFHEGAYAERRQGLMVIRGESIIFIGIGKFDLRNLRMVDYEYLSKIKEEHWELKKKTSVEIK